MSGEVRSSRMLRSLGLFVVGALVASLCATLIDSDQSQKPQTVEVEVQIDKYEADFLTEFVHYQSTGRKTEAFDRLLELIKSRKVKVTLDRMAHAIDAKMCLTCLSASNTFLELYKQRSAAERDRGSLIKLAQDICHLYSLKSYVCDGLIELNADMILYTLQQRAQQPTAEEVCEIAFQGAGCIADVAAVLGDRYPKVNLSSSDKVLRSSKESEINSIDEPFVIIHLTDIHFDPDYLVGVNAECGSEACCRTMPDSEPSDSLTAAGFWGDYRDCDTPWHGVVDVMEQIRAQHSKIDAVYFTGDIIHHFTWNTTLESNEDSMRRIFQLLKERFSPIPVFPIIGNHESHPANLYAPHNVPEKLSSKYLYDFIIKEWEDWLPDDDSIRATIADGGYYTLISPLGHRIIALNNNPCFVHNWWLLHSNEYFMPQLQWMHDTLLEAEAAGEKVHILAHVPSNDPYCYVGWTREYRRIVERFAHIIQGQFNGHSHVDEFNVYYRKDDPSAAVSVAWNGGSTTTFTKLNPNYKVFYVEPESFEILDQETWIYNLTQANLHPDQKPSWFKEYSFKDQYGLQDLSPKTLDTLLQKLARSNDDLHQYWVLKQKNADPMLAKGCDQNCLRETLCLIVSTEFGDDRACDRLLDQ